MGISSVQERVLKVVYLKYLKYAQLNHNPHGINITTMYSQYSVLLENESF